MSRLSCKTEGEEYLRWQAGYDQVLQENFGKKTHTPRGVKETKTIRAGKTDRCVTCHLGIGEPKLKEALLDNPYATHPAIPHRIQEFGCTPCHRGDGTAITTKAAHAGMLPVRYVEASCGRCHKGTVLTEAPHLEEGRRLIERFGCAGCHQIPGFEDSRRTGFDLNGLGSKVTRAWLLAWLRDPKAWSSLSTMPSYRFSSEESNQLADFLMSSTNNNLQKVHNFESGTASSEETVVRGRQIFQSSTCISCHAFDGKGGRVAPELAWIGSKVRPDWLAAWLKDPEKYFARTRMPRYSFPDQQITALAAYMSTLIAPQEKLQAAALPAGSRGGSITAGKEVFIKSRCIGCHALNGVQRPVVLAPSFSGIGSRKVAELDFGNAKIERTLFSWLRTNVKEPHLINPTLSMPDFKLGDLETDRIVTALLSLTSDAPPPKYEVPRRIRMLKSPPTGLAKQVLNRYQCRDCHALGDQGQPLAVDLGLAGCRSPKQWLVAYMKKPYPMRPLVNERMPPFGMSDEESEAVAEYLAENCADQTISGEIFSGGHADKAEIEKGRSLYYDTYGCNACHIIGTDGGIYGPSLNGAGDRMKTGWIAAWIRNPQALVPSTRTPNYGIGQREARSLTAFIASQRQSPALHVPVQAERHLALGRVLFPGWVTGGARYEAERGRDVYIKYCAFCHGERGAGDGPSVDRLDVAPTDFTDIELMARLTRRNLVEAVERGGAGIGKSNLMPPYGKTLSSSQINEVVSYIRTLIPLMNRMRVKQQLVRVQKEKSDISYDKVKSRLAWVEAFMIDAPDSARAGLAPLRSEFQRLTREISTHAAKVPRSQDQAVASATLRKRFKSLSTRIERFQAAQVSAAQSVLKRNELDALNKALGVVGEKALSPPPPQDTYGSTLKKLSEFNQVVSKRGVALFRARGGRLTWDKWTAIYSALLEGRLKEEHRKYLGELEKMGLTTVTVKLR